jgi:hypothetical protein
MPQDAGQNETVPDNKDRAMQGWLTDAPPPPPRTYPPGEEHKWYRMSGGFIAVDHREARCNTLCAFDEQAHRR